MNSVKITSTFQWPKGAAGEQEIDVHADYIALLKQHGIYGSSTSNSVDITTSHGVYGEIKALARDLKTNAYPQVQQYADQLGHGHSVVFVGCRTIAKIFRRNPDGSWPSYTECVEYNMRKHAGKFARDLAKVHGGKKLLTFAEIKRLLLHTSASKFPHRDYLALALSLLSWPGKQWGKTSLSLVASTGYQTIINNLTPAEVQWLKSIDKSYVISNPAQMSQAMISHGYEIKRSSTKASNGQVYTPPEIVQALADMARPHVREDHVFCDIASGCGSFPNGFTSQFPNPFESYDIDAWAIQVLQCHTLGKPLTARALNSLSSVGRRNFPGLRDGDAVISVGNPPWLSRQAHMHQPGVGIKQMPMHAIPAALQGSDVAVSFLRQYSAINSEYIAIVIPFSMLLKSGKYNALCSPSQKSREHFSYELLEARVSTTKRFRGLTGAEFACAATLWKRGKALSHAALMASGRIVALDGSQFKTSNLNSRWVPLSSDKGKRSNIDIHLFSNYGSVNTLISKGRFMHNPHPTSSRAVTGSALEDYSRLIAIKHHWRKAAITASNRLRWANARPPKLPGNAAYYLIDAYLRYKGTSTRADQAFEYAIGHSAMPGKLGVAWGNYINRRLSKTALLNETGQYIRKRIQDTSTT